MISLQVVPQWFFLVSVFMSLFITLIALIITLYSFKIYSLCGKRELKFFGVGFLLIALSYISWSGLNAAVLSQANVANGMIDISEIVSLGQSLIYSHFLLFVAGLSMLTFTTFKTKGNRTYLLFIVLSSLSIIFSVEKAEAFFTVSIVLLVFIIFHYLREFIRLSTGKRFISLLAFFVLLISRFELLFLSNNPLHYIMGHVIEFFAYSLLLINLLLILKNEQEKK